MHAVVITSGIAAIIWPWCPIGLVAMYTASGRGAMKGSRGAMNTQLLVGCRGLGAKTGAGATMNVQLIVGCCGIGANTGGTTGRGLTATRLEHLWLQAVFQDFS